MEEGGANQKSSASSPPASPPPPPPPPEAAEAAIAEPKPEPTPEPAPEPPAEPQPEPQPGPSEESQPPEQPAKMVKTVTSLDEFTTVLKSAGDKLIVLDFSATWCGPCKMIKPFFHGLVEKYPEVIFIEVDVDDAQDVAAHCDVKCMPTFQFYKNNEKVHEFSGANKEKLEETVKKLK